MIWLLLLLPPLLAVDRWMSTFTNAVPIYRSRVMWFGIGCGMILGSWLFMART